MSVPLSFCPNCGTPWPPDTKVCSLCGYMRPLASPVWPPPIAALVAPVPLDAAKLLTGKVWGDTLLGFGIPFTPWLMIAGMVSAFGSHYAYGLILGAPPVLYFALRRRYPRLARGLGYGLLFELIMLPFVLVALAVAVVLGVFALCSSNGHA